MKILLCKKNDIKYTKIMIIKYMMSPDEAPAASKKTIMNILKVAALLMSYNLIFNFMDDVGMILLGAPAGYQYKTLSNFINVDTGKDDGIISRLIFGSKSNIEDVGDFIAFNTISYIRLNILHM